MCGINGITKEDRKTVEKMNSILSHRGPDGSGVYSSSGITLGHTRLAVIDLSTNSAQPMVSADGRYVIVFNGEIYNFKELKEELQSYYQFKTLGDTEVLLAAYIVWGKSFVTKVRGIFALGIWDTQTKTLVLARDHMGVKPLYYSVNEGILSFSSELHTFMRNAGGQMSREAFSCFLSLQYVPSPYTFIEGVFKLKPGHMLEWKGGRVTVVDYQGTFSLGSETDRGIYDTIDYAIHEQLVSDRPVGVYLSGGIDSSVVLHHASAHMRNIRSFSINFEMLKGSESESVKFNTDAELAERTARIYGSHHTTFTITLDDVRRDLIKIYESLDEPISDITGIPQYFLSRQVHEQGVIVALGGDGGDELFGGYNRHRMLMAAYFFQCMPRMVQNAFVKANPRVRKIATPFPVPIHMEYMASKESEYEGITTIPINWSVPRKFFMHHYEDTPQDMHPLDAFMRVDRRTWLPDLSLALSDRFTMAHGLELRVPLLSMEVVSLADTISVYRKTSPFVGKRILRTIYKQHLPEYLFKQPKRGWLAPGAKWLRDPEILHIVKEVLSPGYYKNTRSLFDWKKIQIMLDEHVTGARYHRQMLWNCLVLQIWARKNNVRV